MATAWHFSAVKAREAMAELAPHLGPNADWQGVLVAHLDTGFTNHVVFNLEGARPGLLTKLGRNYMDDANSEPRDGLDYGGGLGVYPGHGTRTAGVLCGNLPGVYVGVAPTVPVIPYRITNAVVLDGKTILHAAAAIMDAVDRHLADVIAISLGVQSSIGIPFIYSNTKEMRVLGRAVDYVYERGVIVIGAGGQQRDAPERVGFVVYPGRYSRTIGVGGVNAKLKICYDYENGRESIDVWAPSDDITRPNSIFGTSEPFTSVNEAADGTSYGVAHVAGAAAMWLRRRMEELEKGGYVGWKRVEAFRALLKETAAKPAGNDVFANKAPPKGTGMLDCLALLRAPLPKISSLKETTVRAEGQIH